jgi:hypothetical protein
LASNFPVQAGLDDGAGFALSGPNTDTGNHHPKNPIYPLLAFLIRMFLTALKK